MKERDKRPKVKMEKSGFLNDYIQEKEATASSPKKREGKLLLLGDRERVLATPSNLLEYKNISPGARSALGAHFPLEM